VDGLDDRKVDGRGRLAYDDCKRVPAGYGAHTMSTPMKERLRAAAQVALGGLLAIAGTGHLTFARTEFQAQVPDWVPLDKDAVVLASGVVELAMAAALLGTWKQPARAVVGATAAGLFVAVFPGNIAQLTGHRDAFGLDTDTKRAVRLLFQPVLVYWALRATDAGRLLRS
jgi:uncharacterized membrane protein